MSVGLVMCSICHREAGQHRRPNADGFGWHHVADGSPICRDGEVVYPKSPTDVVDYADVPQTAEEIDAALVSLGLDPQTVRAQTRPLIDGLNRKARRALKKQRR